MKSQYLPIIPLVVLLSVSSSTFGTAPAGTESRNIESAISDVTVYRNSALVTREASVLLSPGRNELVFSGLAASLNPETVQLSGSGDFLILSITQMQDYLAVHPQEARLQALNARRDSLELLIEDKQTESSILDRELAILNANSTLRGNQENLTAVELRQAMDFFHTKLTELETGKLALRRELTNLRNELQRVRNQISELNSNTSRNRSVVTAVLQSKSAQRVRLTLKYLVASAGWYPSYDLRVEDIDSSAGLSYKANIYQSTGVDWDDLSLTVSSAIPDRGGTLPQLQPWYVNFYTPRPAPREANVPQMGMARSETAQKAMDDEQLEEAVRTVPVQQIQSQTSFSYRIDLPYSVPSGGNPLTVQIAAHDLSADYRYYTVPKLGNRAYLTARVSDWDRYNLLPGDANLFLENTYVGKSTINPQSVGDTLSFSLGRDESIVVERTKLREFEEKNFFGNRVRETFAWEISLRNTKNQAIRISVEDQVPVSQHEDIEVSVNERSGAVFNRQNGKLTWQLNLDPGETRNLRFEYELEYPRGRTVAY